MSHSMRRLSDVELPPFQAAADADVAAIMVAHVTVPALDRFGVAHRRCSPGFHSIGPRQQRAMQRVCAAELAVRCISRTPNHPSCPRAPQQGGRRRVRDAMRRASGERVAQLVMLLQGSC